jgi:serine/threonine protein kinase
LETSIERLKCPSESFKGVKPSNILISSLSIKDILNKKTKIKIIDFGHSVYNNVNKHLNIQTRYYRSPEVILLNNYSFPIDIWSFGCIIFEIMTGKPLFRVKNDIELINNILIFIDIIPKYMIENLFTNIINNFNIKKKHNCVSCSVKKKKIIQKFEIINNYIKYMFEYLTNKNKNNDKEINFKDSINNDNIIDEMDSIFDNMFIDNNNKEYLFDVKNIFIRELIRKMLIIDPKNRFTINKIYDVIID